VGVAEHSKSVIKARPEQVLVGRSEGSSRGVNEFKHEET
jgi:hypothetical protein